MQLPMAGYRVHSIIPDVYKNRRKNRGMEGAAVSPDGRLAYAFMQVRRAAPSLKIRWQCWRCARMWWAARRRVGLWCLDWDVPGCGLVPAAHGVRVS